MDTNDLEMALELIEPIDIRKTVGVKKETDTLNESHYLITVVDTLVKQARAFEFDLAAMNGFIYVYNGEYWDPITEWELKKFLQTTATQLGIDRYKTEYYKFLDNLCRQFVSGMSIVPKDHSDNVIINLKNGTYEFGETPVLRDFDKTDFLAYQLPFAYEEKAVCPMFQNYLDRVLPNKECQNILAEYLGYIFTTNHKQQKCLLLYGSGANGKSVFYDIVRALFGTKNVTNYSLKNLNDENCRAQISNKLLNYASEIDANISNEVFKQLVSGEPIQARLKYKDAFIMHNYAKLIFNCNELPRDIEYTHAYFRRFLIIPFTQVIPEQEQDKDLAAKIIKHELSGIFNWVLSGLKRLSEQERFTESELVKSTIDNFKTESDSLFQFIKEEGYEKSDEATIGFLAAYMNYKQFCLNNGFKPLNSKNFRKRFEALGFYITRVAQGNVIYAKRTGEVVFPEETPF